MDIEKYYLKSELSRLKTENHRLSELLSLKSDSEIIAKRQEIKILFEKLDFLESTEQDIYFSKTENYYFNFETYSKEIQQLYPDSTTYGSVFLYKIQIFESKSKKVLFSFISECYPYNSFCWLLIDNNEYLFYPEFKSGSQSIYAINTNIFYSYYDPRSENQYLNPLTSANSLFMAVQYDNEVQILNSENCTELPLKVVRKKDFLTNSTLNPYDAFQGYSWDNNELTLVYKERLYTPSVYLQVTILTLEDFDTLRFSFYDLNGKYFEAIARQDYFGLKNYIVEGDILPIKSFLSVLIKSFKTINGNKIYTITTDQFRKDNDEILDIEVNDLQLKMNIHDIF